MANMSYCRFQNTVADLQDCYDNMDDTDLSNEELRARWRLIKLCMDIAGDYGDAWEYRNTQRLTTTKEAIIL